MVKVLIVDDSPVVSELISYILSSDPEISVVGFASNGEDAIAMIKKERPDVVTMDINMPGIDGFTATRKIMETTPVPIVIVSSSYKKENVELSIRSMEAGALAIIEKPDGIENQSYEINKRKFIKTVKLMSEIKVVGRRRVNAPEKMTKGCLSDLKKNKDISIIAIGASTGGPQALQTLLQGMKGEVKVPVLIVQHITSGFTVGFAEWLSSTCSLNVKIPVNGEKIIQGTVYVAPDGLHMGVDINGSIVLSSEPPLKNLRPAVSFLFRSVAESYGSKAIGVILTGMGSDGAEELKLMRDRGAVTFAQNEESSIVFGMPGEAIKLGGADCVLPPDVIAVKIKEILENK